MQDRVAAWLADHRPDTPTVFFDATAVTRNAAAFRAGFPGLVTYAVKANPRPEMLAALVAAGIDTFDVASPAEMAAVRVARPDAVLHYNNPVRSPAEVAAAQRHGVASASVDAVSELDKLAPLAGIEVAVRLKLPQPGGAYDFGAKFGVDAEGAAVMLAEVARRGFAPSICFHPGTQCPDPEAWARHIQAAAEVARRAGVTLARLNVGGGFAADRGAGAPDHAAVFGCIARATRAAFGGAAPALICEPGRALAAPGVTVALCVKAIRPDGSVILNDGIYGSLAEWRDMPAGGYRVIDALGRLRRAAPTPRVVWGPTCDSLDRLPAPVALPADLAEGDYLIAPHMGAYAQAIATGFNGYGPGEPVPLPQAQPFGAGQSARVA